MNISDTLLQWSAGGASVIIGIVAIYGQIDRVWKARKKSNDEEDDRLINILKETVEQLEIKLDRQTKWAIGRIEDLTQQLNKIKEENRILIKILQSKYKNTKKLPSELIPIISNYENN